MKIGFSLNSIKLCTVCCRSHLDYFPPPDPSSEYLHNYILRNKIKAVQLSWHLTLTHLWPGLHACPHLASQAIRGGYTGRPIPGCALALLTFRGRLCCYSEGLSVVTHSVYVLAQSGQGYSLGLASAEPRAIVGDEPVRDTTGFSFSANTDGDSGEKETLWEYAQHLQEPTGIFHWDPAESLWQK